MSSTVSVLLIAILYFLPSSYAGVYLTITSIVGFVCYAIAINQVYKFNIVTSFLYGILINICTIISIAIIGVIIAFIVGYILAKTGYKF
jgi:hypothetical protein